jgi:hypothetical protein
MKFPPAIVALVAFTTAAVAEPVPQPKVGQCPSSYRESGGFCTPMTRDAPVAVLKGDRQCPSGFAQSGAYCVEMRRR